MLLLPGKAEANVALPAGDRSTELLAAQQRLEQLQQQARERRLAAGLPVGQRDYGRTPPQSPSLSHIATQLPPHLGWESAAVTAVVRKGIQKEGIRDWRLEIEDCQTISNLQSPISTNETIKLYPDVAIGMLRQKQERAGRVWLLLRHLDNRGQGWLDLETIKTKLTGNGAVWPVCGGRQLRNLLNQGEGVFWVRADGRLWLRSVAKVAAALQVSKLTLKPVAMPVKVLTRTIGEVRAHFYAAFHSSRGMKACKPIARETVAELTHVQPRTQRRYEKWARVKQQPHFAVGGRATAETIEATAWQHGRATFQLKDYRGKQGKPGQEYMAWQLPNSYAGPHDSQPRGQQKRINQALSVLFTQGMTGNGHGHTERRFFGHGRLAAQAYNRGVEHDIYWFDGRIGVWHCLESAGKNDPPF